MVFFFCTFIALRGQDSSNPVSRIKDFELDGKELVFSGYVKYNSFSPCSFALTLYNFDSETIDNHYIHALHIYVDHDTRAVRLHATVLHGELKQ